MTVVPDGVRSLCRALGLGDDPQAILEPLARLYAELEVEVAQRSTGLGLPCRAGCAACCHEAVFLSAPEFLAVGAHLMAWSPDERRSVVETMVGWADHFADELALLDELPAGAERDEVAARIKFTCPLLADDGLCRVYAVRELNARTFGLTRDEARGSAFGCALTHARLRVLPPSSTDHLFGARAARVRLRDRVPGAGAVQVYPWWFKRYGAYLA